MVKVVLGVVQENNEQSILYFLAISSFIVYYRFYYYYAQHQQTALNASNTSELVSMSVESASEVFDSSANLNIIFFVDNFSSYCVKRSMRNQMLNQMKTLLCLK